MKIISDHDQIHEPICLLIGNFDGVHLGHQMLLTRAREIAEHRGLKVAVLSFVPHPLKVLAPERAPKLIQTPRQKHFLLAYHGVDYYIRQSFDRDLAALEPEAFIDNLHKRAPFRYLIVGAKFGFGHNRSGSVGTLERLGSSMEFEVEGIEEAGMSGRLYSSSWIRELLSSGRVDLAGQALGRPYFLEGMVETGDRRGRNINAPTANMVIENELLPKFGVYASWTRVDKHWFRSISNIGIRPSLETNEVRIESHLFDFSGNLYDKHLVLCLSRYMRPEIAFPDLQALKSQIHQDIRNRKAFDDTDPPQFAIM